MVQIGEGDVTFTFARSSGAGGQNVDKRSTKAILSFDVMGTLALTDDKRELVMANSHRLTLDGCILIHCSEHRTQGKNREGALRRLNNHLDRLLAPVKERKASKPSKGAVRRAVDNQKRQSRKKSERRQKWL